MMTTQTSNFAARLAAPDRPRPSPDDLPRPLRWTRAQYYRMADAGLFYDRHVELIDGEIFQMSPQNLPHVSAVFRVGATLSRAFGDAYHFHGQANLRIGDSDPEPDFAVVRLADLPPSGAPTQAALVVEVSASSLEYDRGVKASLYAAGGIPDYWIVNLRNSTLEVRRNPVADEAGAFGFRYADMSVYSADEAVAPLEIPETKVKILDLLPAPYATPRE